MSNESSQGFFDRAAEEKPFRERLLEWAANEGFTGPGFAKAYMGLLEAEAWVVFRDPEVTAAVGFLNDHPHTSKVSLQVHVMNLPNRAGSRGLISIREACIAGDLKAIGKQAGAFSPIPPMDWMDIRKIFDRENEPDIVVPGSSLSPKGEMRGPLWTHVRLPRSEVLSLWPALNGEAGRAEPDATQAKRRRPEPPVRLPVSPPPLIPTSFDRVNPISPEEALHRYIDGKASADTVLALAPDELDNVVDIRGVVVGGKLAPVEEAAAEGRARMERFQALLAVFAEALRSGDIRGYVHNPVNAGLYIIPRTYWNGIRDYQITQLPFQGLPGAAGYDPSMAGQLVLMCRDEVMRWAETATRPGHSETKEGRQPAAPRAKPGPPIDRVWRSKVHGYCDRVGEAAVRAPRSQEEFLRAVKEHYKMKPTDPPTSPKRTHDFREEWLDMRHGLAPRY